MDVGKVKSSTVTNVKEGWGPDGIFRKAHDKVIGMILDKCKSMEEENKLYELLFERQVAKLKAAKYEKQLYYEDVKVKEAKKRRNAGAKLRTRIIEDKEDYAAEKQLYA